MPEPNGAGSAPPAVPATPTEVVPPSGPSGSSGGVSIVGNGPTTGTTFPAPSFSAIAAPTYAFPPARFSTLPEPQRNGWKADEPWSVAVQAGHVPIQRGNQYVSPVVLYDQKTMSKEFKLVQGKPESEGNIYQRGDGFYTVTKLPSGIATFQPISFGGKEGAFGAYRPLSEEEKKNFALVVAKNLAVKDPKPDDALAKVVQAETADSATFLASQLKGLPVQDLPEGTLQQIVKVLGDKKVDSKLVEPIQQAISSAPPAAIPPAAPSEDKASPPNPPSDSSQSGHKEPEK